MLQVRRVMVGMLLLMSGLSAPLRGQEKATPPASRPVPFAVINVASVDRLLKDTESMFKRIDRTDVVDVVKSIVAIKANDLKGIRRDQSLGMMFFLEPGFPPTPTTVIYIPVTNPDEFIATAALFGLPFKKNGPVDGKYMIKSPGKITVYGRFRHGLLLLGPSEVLLDGDLPDPIEMNKDLSARYDMALSLRIKSIPILIRNALVAYQRASFEALTQPRQNVSEAESGSHYATALSLLDIVEQLLTQTDEITIGLDNNEELHKAVIEFELQATPGSDYAKTLPDMAGRPSQFHIVQTDAGKPVTLSLSWKLNPREKKFAAAMVDSMRVQMIKVLPDNSNGIGPANTLCDSLAATVEQGHLDGFVQLAVSESGKLMVLGGLKLSGADAAESSLTKLLHSHNGDNTPRIETGRDSHQGIRFNRISGNGEETIGLIGGKPEFWYGSGQQIFWFAYGADRSFETLKKSMDEILTSAMSGQSDPLVLILHRAQLFALDQAPNDQLERRLHQLGKLAFNSNNDALRVQTRTTEQGLSTRLEFEEGYLKFLALTLASQFDQN